MSSASGGIPRNLDGPPSTQFANLALSQRSLGDPNQSQVSQEEPMPEAQTQASGPRNMIPNFNRRASQATSYQSTLLTSVSSQSCSGKSAGLTAAFEATSIQKLEVMQNQLGLDQQHFDLEVQDQADARAERLLDRQD